MIATWEQCRSLASFSAGVRSLNLTAAACIFSEAVLVVFCPAIASEVKTVHAESGVCDTGARSAVFKRFRISSLVFSSGVKTFLFGLGFAATFFFGFALLAAGFFAALRTVFFVVFLAAAGFFFAAAFLTSFFTRVVGLVAAAVVAYERRYSNSAAL